MPEHTLSQRLSAFLAGLRYDDLPPAVIDKAKAVLAHAVAVGLLSLADDDVAVARRVAAEDGPGPARLLGVGDRVTRSSAAFFNSVLIHARGQDDSYRMLTHPGAAVIPCALAEAEGRGVAGKAMLTALVAAYEAQCRIARDIIPSVQNHGFRSSSVFAIFGATVAAARLRGLTADQLAHALAYAVATAGGCVETSRAGAREQTYQEPMLCPTGMLAARLAQQGVTGAATSLDGPAGFLFSFTGSASGALTGSFDNQTTFDPQSIVADLGQRWEIVNVTMKIYSAAGFNQPVIDGVAALARRHDLDPGMVRSMTIEMNEWETVYPSAKFPRRTWQGSGVGTTAYFAASALVHRGYSPTGARFSYGGDSAVTDPDEVRALAERTTVVAGPRPQYAPRITVTLTDGRALTHEMSGDEFKWDFATEVEKLETVRDALPLTKSEYDALIETIATLERCDNIDRLIDATVATR